MPAKTNAERKREQRAKAREEREAAERAEAEAAAASQPPADDEDEEEQDASSEADAIWDEVKGLHRNWVEVAKQAGGNPEAEGDSKPSSGDFTVDECRERSSGIEWDRAFLHAKRKGNSNKASCIFADSHFVTFQRGD